MAFGVRYHCITFMFLNGIRVAQEVAFSFGQHAWAGVFILVCMLDQKRGVVNMLWIR